MKLLTLSRGEGPGASDPAGDVRVRRPDHGVHREPLRRLRLRRCAGEAEAVRHRARKRLLPRRLPGRLHRERQTHDLRALLSHSPVHQHQHVGREAEHDPEGCRALDRELDSPGKARRQDRLEGRPRRDGNAGGVPLSAAHR
ncbi:UNVERIFIED_CONTAM: hypothetical protein GTU68_056258 [Idotea baltica]|nr:hypothetical protein [Idotea baltica]